MPAQYAPQQQQPQQQQYGAPPGMPGVLAPAYPGSGGGLPSAAGPATPPAKPAAPAPPPGPPANISIQTADTSKVPADQKAVVASLTNLFNACIPLANNPGEPPRHGCCSRDPALRSPARPPARPRAC